MELYQLKSFVAIAREHNLTRAAEALHISQSALSSQIKVLEAELGLALFERQARGMALTEEGRILLGHAHNLLEDSEALKRTAESLRQRSRIAVNIGLNTDPTFLRISEINQRLALLHSGLSVIFHASETANTVQRLRNGLIDLGFFYGSMNEPDISQTIISQIRICVVIPKKLISDKQPGDWQEIADLPWVWVDDNFPFFLVMQEKMGDFQMRPGSIVTAANEQIVRELVIAGQGVAIMREDEAQTLVAEGRVYIWEKGWGTIPLSLAWRQEESEKSPVKETREAIGYIWGGATGEGDGSLSDKVWA